ncbi:hypothetical protein DYU05_09920 [Mucilaginibacter terrenus]|uniref:FAD-binding FR-type domain-containing protein n=1 Tax=Mucilaginibacter terrenus TaxID=2482727 RepID=A0A3E2NYF0_9SPHI|nr:SIP domain-containing protein [Mucilaginibacter terrenus]RFZ85880.1 hypothetical protein DYU05_09920 [Mucilaginibacter terrenus]
MESPVLQKLKAKAGSLLEKRLIQSGKVLEVRHWVPSTMIEVDLHLPAAEVAAWQEVPYLKFKVADLTYRDYTPSGWDAETRTCTIYVDAAHIGPGSRWASSLKKGDEVYYIKVGSTRHSPKSTPAIIGLGDESSMGHLLALQQMVVPKARFSGAVVIANEDHRRQFEEYFWSPLQPLARTDVHGHQSIIEWVKQQHYDVSQTAFYLAGNNTMVQKVRKMLREMGFPPAQISTQGFWS